ncbi:MAG: chemotaxis protein CheW [Anaerolineaceae bacterium]|nr:chemotaxis protein CheW [Anaerolineaceae bacterium]
MTRKKRKILEDNLQSVFGNKKVSSENEVIPESTAPEPEAPSQAESEPPIEEEAQSTSSEPVSETEPSKRISEESDKFLTVEEEPVVQAIALVSEDDEAIRQLLVFKIESEYYGIDISRVRTIIKPQVVYELPLVEKYIKGLINLRGEVVPVLDLRIRLGLDGKQEDENTRFIVIEAGDYLASFVVDAVDGVYSIPENCFGKASNIVISVDNEYIDSIANFENKIILVLNLTETIGKYLG